MVLLRQVIHLEAIFETPLEQYAWAFCMSAETSNPPKLFAKHMIKIHIWNNQSNLTKAF